MNTLLINAHLNYPDWSEGSLNESMSKLTEETLAKLGHEVVKTNIELGYNIDEEVQKHIDADLVILQTPINWFGAPWIYKKYVDEVFNAGLHSKIFLDNDGRTRSDPTRQYGTGGHMQGKTFMISATWNAPTETFSNPDSVLFEGRSIDDLLLSITSNYKFVGYDIAPNYGIFDIYKDGTDIAHGVARLKKHIEQVIVP